MFRRLHEHGTHKLLQAHTPIHTHTNFHTHMHIHTINKSKKGKKKGKKKRRKKRIWVVSNNEQGRIGWARQITVPYEAFFLYSYGVNNIYVKK